MNSGKRILIVDDDEAFRGELAEQLGLHESCEVLQAGTGKEGLELAKAHPLDALILDVGLPDTDGRDLCRLIRKAGVKAPVIMLTGHDSDRYDPRLTAAPTTMSAAGAARRADGAPARPAPSVRAVRRRDLPDRALCLQAGGEMLVTAADKKIHLTEKETAILKHLFRVGDRRGPRHAARRGLGPQRGGDDAHAGDARLSPAAEIEPIAGENTLLLTEPCHRLA